MHTLFLIVLILAIGTITPVALETCTSGGGSCIGYYGVCCNSIHPGHCCPIGSYCCSAAMNYGCCPTGYTCLQTTCLKRARDGNGPSEIEKKSAKSGR